MVWNYLSFPKLQLCGCSNLAMNKQFHSTLYWACDYLLMPEFKLIHISERFPCPPNSFIDLWSNPCMNGISECLKMNSTLKRIYMYNLIFRNPSPIPPHYQHIYTHDTSSKWTATSECHETWQGNINRYVSASFINCMSVQTWHDEKLFQYEDTVLSM